MATEIGQAYVQIMPSFKGINGAIKGQLDPEASSAGASAGDSLGNKFVAIAKGIIIAAGIGKVFSATLMEGANLQQSLGGVETLFKDNADKVKGYANEAYKTTGLSANAYMENVTGFSASLLQSVGGDTEKAADVANMAMIDMSDNANKMGTNMQDIQNAYQGFAKQNYTMLDNLKLGYGGTKEEMQRLLTDAEKLTGVHYDINNLNDVYQAVHAVQEELDITGTTAKEASETFSGSLSAMKSSFSNVLGKLALGEDIKPSLQALATTTSTFFFGNFIPMVGNILQGIPTLVTTLFSTATPLIIEAGMNLLNQLSTGVLSNIPTFLTSLQGIIVGMMGWVSMNLPSILAVGVEILTQLANGILQSLPQLITTIGTLFNSFVEFFLFNMPVILEAGKNLLLNLVDGIIANLPAIGQSAIQIASGFIDSIVQFLPEFVSKGWEILQSLIQGLLERLPDLISTAIELLGQFALMLISKIPDIIAAGWEIIKGLVSGIVSMIPDIINAGIEIMKSLLGGLSQIIPEILSAIGRLGSDIISSISNINLMDAGKAIMDGFLGGLKSAWGAVTDFVGGIADWIAEHKGPIQYDRKLLTPAGAAIMGSLNSSLQDKFKDVKKTVVGMADEIADSFNVNRNLVADELEKFNSDNMQAKVVFERNNINTLSNADSIKYATEGAKQDRKDNKTSAQDSDTKQPINIYITNESDLEAIRTYVNQENATDDIIRVFK